MEIKKQKIKRKFNIIKLLIFFIILFVIYILLVNVPLPLYTKYKIKSAIKKYNNETSCKMSYLHGHVNGPTSFYNTIEIKCGSTNDRISVNTLQALKNIEKKSKEFFGNYKRKCKSKSCIYYGKNAIGCIKESKKIIYYHNGKLDNIEKEICLFNDLYD
jgi:hypothetical protein